MIDLKNKKSCIGILPFEDAYILAHICIPGPSHICEEQPALARRFVPRGPGRYQAVHRAVDAANGWDEDDGEDSYDDDDWNNFDKSNDDEDNNNDNDNNNNNNNNNDDDDDDDNDNDNVDDDCDDTCKTLQSLQVGQDERTEN